MSTRPRRHWSREVGNPLTMFHEKRKKGDKSAVKWSMARVIVAVLVLYFVRHKPSDWNDSARDVVAILVFGLAIQVLLSMVPVGEALAATQAFFGNVMGRNLKAAAEALPQDIPEEEPKT